MNVPDFYLTSNETYTKFDIRKCFIKERLKVEKRDDYLRVSIIPTIVGQQYGLGDKEIEDIVLATRFDGHSLFPVSEWPMPVYICRILNEKIINSGKAKASDLEIIAWGEIHQEIEDNGS